jgi:hypothetical protein
MMGLLLDDCLTVGRSQMGVCIGALMTVKVDVPNFNLVVELCVA